MRRLNIFVDETGEFGFGKGASELYGVSFTFHEQNDDIMPELSNLNERLNRIGYTKMIHMADLIMRRGDYSNFDRYEKRFRPRASARKTLVGLRGNLLPQFGKNVV